MNCFNCRRKKYEEEKYDSHQADKLIFIQKRKENPWQFGFL